MSKMKDITIQQRSVEASVEYAERVTFFEDLIKVLPKRPKGRDPIVFGEVHIYFPDGHDWIYYFMGYTKKYDTFDCFVKGFFNEIGSVTRGELLDDVDFIYSEIYTEPVPLSVIKRNILESE